MHVTAGALLIRGGENLFVEHRTYKILLQPGGHVEPTDASLLDAAVRELVEETRIAPSAVAPAAQVPAYIEYGLIPARPDKDEPAHHHLDFGYAFTTNADAGRIQEGEIASAGWYTLADAEHLVGRRVARALDPTAAMP
jgi:8-oxo-dGTP pyrophosphatase MutT (NUDIX family)